MNSKDQITHHLILVITYKQKNLVVLEEFT